MGRVRNPHSNPSTLLLPQGRPPTPVLSSSSSSSSSSELSLFDLKSTEPKLVHIIQKILTTPCAAAPKHNHNHHNPSSSSSSNNHDHPSPKQVLEIILSRHREYRRKNSKTLLGYIETVLSHLLQTKTTTPNNNNHNSYVGPGIGGRRPAIVPIGGGSHHRAVPSPPPPIREVSDGRRTRGLLVVAAARNDDDDDAKEEEEEEEEKEGLATTASIDDSNTHDKGSEESSHDRKRLKTQHPKPSKPPHPPSSNNSDQEYDQQAILHDHLRSSPTTAPMSLNASLQTRYKNVQRSKDISARKKKAAQDETDRRELREREEMMLRLERALGEVERLKREQGDGEPMEAAGEEGENENGHGLDVNGNGVSASTSTPPLPPPAVAASTPPPTPSPTTLKRKKKKKRLIRISSSASLQSNTSVDRSSSTAGGGSGGFPGGGMNEGGINPEDAPSTVAMTPRPKERYEDLGGMASTLKEIRELIEYPLSHPELFSHLGIDPPRGVLLRGPPGCGKTHLANAIAGQLNLSYYRISAPELVSSLSGESESRIRTLFSTASSHAPSLIFIDEIDAIAPKRGSGGDSGGKAMEKRIVAQLLTCMDGLRPENNRGGRCVMVLGATNRPDSLDAALRRAGRFDREICLGVPDERGREGILRVMTGRMRLGGDIDFRVLAKRTPGYVGADVRSLTKEAGVMAINRIFKDTIIRGGDGGGDGGGVGETVETVETVGESLLGMDDHTDGNAPIINENNHDDGNGDITMTTNDTTNTPPQPPTPKTTNPQHPNPTTTTDIHSTTPLTPTQLEPLYVTMSDFLLALPHVQPSSKREGFATVPDVSWENVGALTCIREELALSVLEPITNPEKFEALGLPLPAGVLLYGPPGCGKTLLAKAIANESGANFISIKGPELLDKYVGESERAVRLVFERARSSSPCIVFFDELDSLCPKRGSDSGGGGGGVSERVVNQLLTEMDGLDSRRSVFVIAATNRPELIDPAMLRPGRLDKLLYVPLPSPQDRIAILKALASKVNLAPDVDLEAIATNPRADGYSGADCAALLREAGLAVLRDGSSSLVRSRAVGGGGGTSPSSDAIGDHSQRTKDVVSPPLLQVTLSHFDYAFDHVLPSVSKSDQAKYNKIRNRMARARARGGVVEKEKEKASTGEDHSGDKVGLT